MWWILGISAALAGSLGAEPEVMVQKARRALHDLDLEGVRMYTRQALARPGAHEEEARYLMGLAWQLDERPADALALYREAYARHPHGAFRDQLEFGIAETSAETGDPRAALRWLRKARRGRELSLQDEPKFAIDRALFILQKGRLKRGTKKLLAALDATDHDLATWHQARARTYLVNQWLDIAAGCLQEREAVLYLRAPVAECAHGGGTGLGVGGLQRASQQECVDVLMFLIHPQALE